MVKALVLHMDLPRAATTRLLKGRGPNQPGGFLSGLKSLSEAPTRDLPGPDWVQIRPILSGICGTDLAVLSGKQSPSLSPFSSFPAVPGHEILGRVVAAGPGAEEWVGKRVAVDPALTCAVRGLDLCPACQAGEPQRCRNVTQGAFSPGLLIGFCRDLPGGWSEVVYAHKIQLLAIPDDIPDERAVLMEPLSVALHAAIRHKPLPGEKVLLIGAGTIGLMLVAALREVDPEVDLTVVARHPFQAEKALALGASRVRGDAFKASLELTGAEAYKPLIGPHVTKGGFDRVFDAVGSPQTVAEALRAVREGGHVVIVGGAGEMKADWTPFWSREITVSGTYAYGFEPEELLPERWRRGEGRRWTFELALDILKGERGPILESLVTHKFRLDNWKEAFATLWQRKKGKTPAIKVVFTFPPA